MKIKHKLLIIFFLLCAFTGFADLLTQYRCGEPLTLVTQIKPQINIVNNGPDDVDLSTLQVRYYYTKEGTAPEEAHIDYAFIGSTNVITTIYDGFIEIGFTGNAGILTAGSETGDILVRVNKTDWSVYDQADDWSFDPLIEGYTDERFLPLFKNGDKIWGYYGPGGITPTPTTSPVPEGYVINVWCNGMEKTKLKFFGDYEGEAETPFTIGPYPKPFSVNFEPTELDIEGNTEADPEFFYTGYFTGYYEDFTPWFPDENPIYKVELNETTLVRDINVCYREYGAPTPAPRIIGTPYPEVYVKVIDEVTNANLSGVDVEMYIEDDPEPVILTTGSFGSISVDLEQYHPSCNFLFKINQSGYHPYEVFYTYNRSNIFPLYVYLYPLSETTPDPTPTQTPLVIQTPKPEIHQTWTSFIDWDPVIQLYHYNESFAVVTQTIYDPTIRVVDWRIPEISGTTITVNAQLMECHDTFPRFKNEYTHEYHLGLLTENQTYTFIFKADSYIVKEVPFTVQPSPMASPYPGAITDYYPTTKVKIETIGDLIYADVTYLLFENEDIVHVVNPEYPLQGVVALNGNVFSAQPDILRYVGSEDIVSEQIVRHYSVKYMLGALLPGTYTFSSFNTTMDFTIRCGPTPSPTPVHESIFLIGGYVDKTDGITLSLTGDKTASTTPRPDGYYCFGGLRSSGEYTVTILYKPEPPAVKISGPPDLSNITGNVDITAEVTSEVCMFLFDPPNYTYSGLLSNRLNQNFTTGSPSDCCMLITKVDYYITGGSGVPSHFSDTTESMCSHTYHHLWDSSQYEDWSCTITVVATDESGKTGMDMITIFNDESPTPSPTPGSIENPGAVWFIPRESEVSKNISFATDVCANTGDHVLGAYGFWVEFNPDIIRLDMSIGLDGVEPGVDGFVAAANGDTPGELRFSGFDPYGKGPGLDLQVAIIHWLPIEEGTSPLNLFVKSLVNQDTDGIGDFQGIAGSVTVLPPILPGDVNDDTAIDIVDALLIAQYFVGMNPVLFNSALADVNCDGSINIVDALMVAQYFVGFITDFC